MRTVQHMSDSLKQVTGVTTSIDTPIGEAVEPYVEVRWDTDRYAISVAELKQALRDGDPVIEVRALFLSDGQLHMTATMLKPGEAEIVIDRVIEILRNNAVT